MIAYLLTFFPQIHRAVLFESLNWLPNLSRLRRRHDVIFYVFGIDANFRRSPSLNVECALPAGRLANRQTVRVKVISVLSVDSKESIFIIKYISTGGIVSLTFEAAQQASLSRKIIDFTKRACIICRYMKISALSINEGIIILSFEQTAPAS